MNAAAYHYLITIALAALIAWTVGLELGRWSARREARRVLHRRQVLSGLHAVDSARGRHPSKSTGRLESARLGLLPRVADPEDDAMVHVTIDPEAWTRGFLPAPGVADEPEDTPVLTTAPSGGALSIDQAAAYASIGRSKLYGLIRSGEIDVVKVGSRTIVPRSQLDAFIARNTSSEARA